MNLKFYTHKFWSDMGYGLGSSPYLVRRLVSLADISGADTIVELGAGYGQVTEYLIQYKSKNTKLIVVENDPERVVELRRKYGQYCEVHEVSAAHINEIVDLNSIDIVISTLPLGSISDEWVDHILGSVHAILRQWGRFIQFQYALQNIRAVRRYFDVARIAYEPRNFWPAFIYQAHKK